MANITLSLDDDLVTRVRKVAIERHTSMNSMIREFLETVAQADEARRRLAVRALRRSFAEHSTPMGKHTWTRDELHER